MCLACLKRVVLCLVLGVVAAATFTQTESAKPAARVLRVACDPNNLPFSNEKLEGFENKLADLIARDLGAKLDYYWHAQRRGFLRESLDERRADFVVGVATGTRRALPTIPYYRSSYVFLNRESDPAIKSFDDPGLRSLRIGVPVVGDDGENPPAAYILPTRGLINNVVGFTVYGDYSRPNPPARIVEAVAKGDVDVASVWGPLAAYFAPQQTTPLRIVTPPQPEDLPQYPLAYSISMGVKLGNTALRDELNDAIRRNSEQITRILDEYHVPRLPIGDEAR